MKFYGNGSSAVWDPEKNKLLCEFTEGELETTDARIIGILKTAGYKGEGEEKKEPAKEPSKFDGMDAEQLKAYAAENKIEIGNSTSITGILKKITDAEKKTEE